MPGDTNLHEGHRKRMLERVRRDGIESLDEHQVLEVLLYYALPRIDTNAIAHELLNKFRTLALVCEATPEELTTVKGVGPRAAEFLTMIPGLTISYLKSRFIKGVRLENREAMNKFLMTNFIGKRDEIVYVLALNHNQQVLKCEEIAHGTKNRALFDISKIIDLARYVNAKYIVIAHNHPNGLAIPSDDDINTTMRVKAELEKLGITLLDHIIVSNPVSEHDLLGSYVSFADSNMLSPAAGRSLSHSIRP